MADFLLELLSEEIPARMQAKARSDLSRLMAEGLETAGLGISDIRTYSTPRRLVLVARDLPEATGARSEEIKGPRANAPEQALAGFLKKTGLTREQLEDRNGVLFARIERPGRAAGDVLAELVVAIVRDFPWPKSMRWGSGDLRWVRPLHGIVALLGDAIVSIEVDGVTAGAATVGHHFHHPGPITIGGADDYFEKLRACHVIVDHEEREAIIREGAAKLAQEAGLALVADEGLVVENAGLTEWPVPLLGRFDAAFLDVPREVIVLTMRTNQRYFACAEQSGNLAPTFVCVANVDASDGGEAIVDGNRRVLAARLSDARFFWEQDLKVPLEEQAKKLSGIVFHEKLGTVADKVERVAKLGRWLVEEGIITPSVRVERSRDTRAPRPSTTLGTNGDVGQLADQVERAARLCKADLVTGMVGEFPELQGVIGGYLARAQGEPDAVADAVRDHYKPVGQGDEVPTAPVTVAVALADKLDTIASFFHIDQKPTGSRDPFALRRAALGIISLVLTNGLRTDFRLLLLHAFYVSGLTHWFRLVHGAKRMDENISSRTKNFGELIKVRGGGIPVEIEPVAAYEKALKGRLPDDKVEEAVLQFADLKQFETLPFFGERIAVQQRDAGVRADIIQAVFSLGEGDLVRLLARVKALQAFVETGEGADLLTAYKRASNILKKEGWDLPGVMAGPGEQAIPQTGEEDPLVLVEEPAIAEAVAQMAGGSTLPTDAPVEEQELVAALDKAERSAQVAVEAEDFEAAMVALSSLRGPIDAFFDKVTVNDPQPDVRRRRLNLLARFRGAVRMVADFSKIEG
jgi:glycyl-tRNA synthetase beta chain